MAPVYREITLEWGGETYTVTPTYALIQQVEQRLSLASLLERTMSGRPPLSQLADLLAMCLRAAGCKDKDATAENINAELYSEVNAEALTVGATNILLALLPQRVTREKKAPAPEKGSSTSETSTGESTIKSPLDTSESNPQSSGR